MSIFTEKKQAITALKAHLNEPKRIVLTTHINPDGDAIGSIKAMQLVLRAKGHHVTAIIPNEMPGFLTWLDAEKALKVYNQDTSACNEAVASAEIIFCLDYNTLKRVEDLGEQLAANTCPKVLIDHHPFPDAFDFPFSDPQTSSTCEMVYDFLAALDYLDTVTTHVAQALYTGITTDTGSFRYRGTSANTLRVGAALVEAGVNPGELNDRIHNSSSLNRLKLTGHAISNCMEIIEDKGIAFIFLSLKDLEAFDYQPGDTEGLVNMALGVDTVRISILFKETEDKIKISFRSKGDVAVNQFASEHFNGGGHANAAGGASFENWETTRSKFLNAVQDAF